MSSDPIVETNRRLNVTKSATKHRPIITEDDEKKIFWLRISRPAGSQGDGGRWRSSAPTLDGLQGQVCWDPPEQVAQTVAVAPEPFQDVVGQAVDIFHIGKFL